MRSSLSLVGALAAALAATCCLLIPVRAADGIVLEGNDGIVALGEDQKVVLSRTTEAGLLLDAAFTQVELLRVAGSANSSISLGDAQQVSLSQGSDAGSSKTGLVVDADYTQVEALRVQGAAPVVTIGNANISATPGDGLELNAAHTQVNSLVVADKANGATVTLAATPSAADFASALSVAGDVAIAGSLNGANVDALLTMIETGRDIHFARSEFSYAMAKGACEGAFGTGNGVLPLHHGLYPLALDYPQGRTGTALCGLNNESGMRRCGGFVYLFTEPDGTIGTWGDFNLACSERVPHVWPWAKSIDITTSVGAWSAPNTQVLCCLPAPLSAV